MGESVIGFYILNSKMSTTVEKETKMRNMFM
jgi:hypothetical protein